MMTIYDPSFFLFAFLVVITFKNAVHVRLEFHSEKLRNIQDNNFQSSVKSETSFEDLKKHDQKLVVKPENYDDVTGYNHFEPNARTKELEHGFISQHLKLSKTDHWIWNELVYVEEHIQRQLCILGAAKSNICMEDFFLWNVTEYRKIYHNYEVKFRTAKRRNVSSDLLYCKVSCVGLVETSPNRSYDYEEYFEVIYITFGTYVLLPEVRNTDSSPVYIVEKFNIREARQVASILTTRSKKRLPSPYVFASGNTKMKIKTEPN